MPEFEVPTIDVSPYLVPGANATNSSECAEVARLVDRACREVGFIQIVGHGIPESAQQGLADAIDEFFFLPAARKEQYRRDQGSLRGYTPPRSDALSMSLGVVPANMMNDFYEAFTVGSEASWYPELELPEARYAHNTWPDAAPGFRARVERYYADAEHLSRVLMGAFTDALGLEPGSFDGFIDHSIDSMKMNNYTLPEGEIEIAGELTGMGAHTDFGIFTILWADRVQGLQVLGEDGLWHDVQPAEGALLINLGDAMARWTNDQWKSTLHRVQPPVVDGQVIRRRSAAFFFDGNHEAVVQPLPGMVRDGEDAYLPITIADHIAAKAAGLQAGKAPADAQREAARVLAAG
jgi:isopenicillin N synthase-like dioxygenase